ncbi:hypothetical protein KCU98_g646, partial [Aureobasidium melanogenum]
MTVTTMLPPDALVLVTAANGLVASHVVDRLLEAGFRVRGTVRDLNKNKWMVSLFQTRYGPDRFALIEVPNPLAPNAWDASVKDVSGIAHVFGATDIYTQDYEQAVAEELPAHISLLEAAVQEPRMKAFVFTSSAWAAYTPMANNKTKVDEWTWNSTAIHLASSSDGDAELKFFANYMALKTVLEQRIWAYIRSRRFPYTCNSILLATVIGNTLQPRELGMPSTAGMVKWVYDGENNQILAAMQPQWCVDTRDAALLYVAALTTLSVNQERLFAFGDRYSWFKVAQILEEMFPAREIMSIPDRGWDQTQVCNQRAELLLKSMGQGGWTTLKESVKAGSECF